MAAQKLAGLPPQAYEHPSDAAALDALTRTAGLDALVRQLNEWGFERFVRVRYTGSHLRVSPDSFGELHGLLTTVCDRLDLPTVPEMYVKVAAEINAFTVGVDRPLIVLHSAAIDLLTPEELTFLIGHQVGYIKSGHRLYHDIAEFLLPIIENIADSVPLFGAAFNTGLRFAFVHWKRMSTFTADRAGLLACQDVDVAWRTMMKWAGLPQKYFEDINTEDFLRQAREFDAMDTDRLTLVVKWLSIMDDRHPWTVARAQQLLRWIEGGGYEHILRVAHQRQCQWPLRGTETYCPGCGWAVAPLFTVGK